MSDSDEDYVADEDEVDPNDEGYSTDYSSGNEEDNESYFGQDMDLDSLLHLMAEPQAGDGQLQPYQILRQQRNQQGRPKGGKGRKKRGAAAAADEAGSDEDWQDDEPMELTTASEPKRKKTKKQRSGGGRRGPRQMELPEHISRMVGHANLLYASNKYQQAVDLLLEVIRQVPNLSDPYHTLGALHEVLDQPRQALNFYMIAAHMSGKDVALWHKLAEMSHEQGFVRQAIYCWNKVLMKDKEDFESRFARAQLYPLVNEPWKAKQQYKYLLDNHPGHPEVVKALVTLYHDFGQAGRAIELLEEQLAKHYAKVDLTHINMLADLYMAMGHFNNAIQLINRSEQVMCVDDPLPIDLKVRRGACYTHIGDEVSARADLDDLLSLQVVDPETQEDFQDLYLLVVQEVSRVGMHELALPFMDKLKDAPGVLDVPDHWGMLADCYVKAGRRDSAIALYAQKLIDLGMQDPRYMEASLALAALHLGGGNPAAAESVLASLDEAIAAHKLTLPEGQMQQLELFLAKASLQLQLGHKQAFAASVAPHITRLLEQMESNGAILTAATKAQNSGAVPKELVKALKRRKMYARKGGRKGEGGGEVESVFRGYESRDRRKPHIVKADKAAEQLLRRAKAAGAVSGAEDSDAEPDEEDEAAAAAAAAAAAGGGEGGDLPAELAALVAAAAADQEETPDLFGNEQLYSCFIELVHVLMDLGQEEQAAALLARAQAVSAYSLSYRDPSWTGPSALQDPRKAKRKSKAAAAAGDGNLSDWAPGADAAAAAAGGAAGPVASDRRDQVKVLREGLKLLSAELAFRQGNVEETLKLLKTVLPKWPYSWRAWSLYCSCAGRLGRVQHWMKAVAALRAKHPDSLPLQVLAAHADNMSGEAGSAIQGYAAALMQLPNEPLLLLCLGVAQIDAALTARHIRDRNTALLRGFAALHTYARHRGPAAEAEAAYNLGRAAHEVGLLHVAVAHYERVLQLEHEAAADEAVQQLDGLDMQDQTDQSCQQQQQRLAGQIVAGMQVDGDAQQGAQDEQQQKQQPKQKEQQQKQQQQKLQQLGRGLVREAAHNLCMIYKGSGADDLARQVMRTYLTV